MQFILQEIIREYPNYYLDEIVGEMINKTEEEVTMPTLWRYNKFVGRVDSTFEETITFPPIELISEYLIKIGQAGFDRYLKINRLLDS
ncbi:hypothetical protein RhiirA4_482304 [Rhizophagus irregularis]|uniref:Uncharacterized protein n=1 Tax=Rhizophagus irregularis TaxID=588596 RepID=A0A2I1HKX4_9GLOM|nr:hypothetical protein RhiirA4_482304 [Rhizophagus irregularis]